MSRPISRLRRISVRQLALLVGVGGLLGLASCATGEYKFRTTIATGEKIEIPLQNGGPAPAKEGPIQVQLAMFLPATENGQKGLRYQFALTDRSPTPPRSIRVEDVTDDHTVLLAEDLQPHLNEGRWMQRSAFIPGTDPSLGWLQYVDDAMRVFRFTVETGDGRTVTLYQGWSVPGWAKPRIRPSIGMP